MEKPTKRYLLDDLKRCGNLRRLYGIRKGIGVVAEDGKEETIHFAVYVPWRVWEVSDPLLHLSSRKLPFLLYMHRRKFEMYNGELDSGVLRVELNALMLAKSESLWTDSSKWNILVYHVVKEQTKKQRIKLTIQLKEAKQGKTEFEKKDRGYVLRIEVPVTEENRITYQGEEYYSLELVHREKDLKVPILVRRD